MAEDAYSYFALIIGAMLIVVSAVAHHSKQGVMADCVKQQIVKEVK